MRHGLTWRFVVALMTLTPWLAAVAGGAGRTVVGKVAFDLLAGDRDHLAVAPLGRTAEYPSYIANDDQNPPLDMAAEKFSLGSLPPDPTRAIVPVLFDDYAAIWLLAATDDDPALAETVTFRFGVIDGMARVVYHDFEAVLFLIGKIDPLRPGFSIRDLTVTQRPIEVVGRGE